MTEREREMPNPTGQAHGTPQDKRWGAEFPYHWDVDDLVSRRELLGFAVFTSGALFVGTAVLALLGLIRRPASSEPKAIASASEVPEGQASYFRYPGPEDEAVLVHLPGGQFVAYSQRCTHLSCAVYYQAERGRLLCPCHEGVFDPRTGEPIAGPPQRRLPRITLEQRGDSVYATGVEL